jgi:hypothetical protein
VQRRGLVGEAELAAGTLDEEERGGLADAAFDRREADQGAVELVEDLANAGGLILGAGSTVSGIMTGTSSGIGTS